MDAPKSLAGSGAQAARLRALRADAGLTLATVARYIGYSVSHLSNVERGTRKATPQLVCAYEDLARIGSCTEHVGGMGATGVAERQTAARVDTQGAATPAATPAAWPADRFGTRLMRLRLDRGWSLRQLSRVTRVSYQYLGNLEHGHKAPSERVAEICDRTLIGDGTLLALALSAAGKGRSPGSMSGDESNDSVMPSAGPVGGRPRAPCSPDGLGGYGEPVPLTDPEVELPAQWEAFLQVKAAAQTERPGEVFPAVARRADLCASVAAVRGPGGQDHWLWAARFAELAGWMAQEAGWTACADQWTDAAVRWAACGGDRDMAAYAWERRSLVPFCRGDARAAVDLAGVGAAAAAGTRVRGLAECRVAQGLALAGDADGCRRALDRARVLLTAQTEPPPSGAQDMPWGSGSMPAIPAFVEAWCLIDLGRAAQAVELFGSILEHSVSPWALRTRTRYLVRAALAFAGSGEHAHAGQLIKELLPALAQVDSASVRADTRNLIRLLSRRRVPALAGLLPDLHNIARCAPQP